MAGSGAQTPPISCQTVPSSQRAWTPSDLPGLCKVIKLYDATERGELQRSAELRMSMDNYGITPKGQQDRRWLPPKAEEPEAPKVDRTDDGPYAHLRAIQGGRKAATPN